MAEKGNEVPLSGGVTRFAWPTIFTGGNSIITTRAFHACVVSLKFTEISTLFTGRPAGATAMDATRGPFAVQRSLHEHILSREIRFAPPNRFANFFYQLGSLCASFARYRYDRHKEPRDLRYCNCFTVSVRALRYFSPNSLFRRFDQFRTLYEAGKKRNGNAR